MSSVLDRIVKLPRYVRLLSTNGINCNTAIVYKDNDNYQRDYYIKNRNWISEKKKIYNQRPEVKQRSCEYHKAYYLQHKQELNLKHKQYLRNRKLNINN